MRVARRSRRTGRRRGSRRSGVTGRCRPGPELHDRDGPASRRGASVRQRAVASAAPHAVAPARAGRARRPGGPAPGGRWCRRPRRAGQRRSRRPPRQCRRRRRAARSSSASVSGTSTAVALHHRGRRGVQAQGAPGIAQPAQARTASPGRGRGQVGRGRPPPIHSCQTGSTRATGVCWSMTSDTKTPHGHRPAARQGRSRRATAYQSARRWCSSAGGTRGNGQAGAAVTAAQRSDVALEDAGLGQAGQALADGAGPALADAVDGLQVVQARRRAASGGCRSASTRRSTMAPGSRGTFDSSR